MTDSISDMITRIKNGALSKKESVLVPFSNVNMTIADVLCRHGYIKSFAKKGKKNIRSIDVRLSYNGLHAPVTSVTRVSRSSRRVYRQAKTLRPFRNGYGIMVLSTPKGVMSEREAMKARVG